MKKNKKKRGAEFIKYSEIDETTSNSKEELMTTKQCQFCFKIFDKAVFYQCPRCNESQK